MKSSLGGSTVFTRNYARFDSFNADSRKNSLIPAAHASVKKSRVQFERAALGFSNGARPLFRVFRFADHIGRHLHEELRDVRFPKRSFPVQRAVGARKSRVLLLAAR
jgi:hypothetical protein